MSSLRLLVQLALLVLTTNAIYGKVNEVPRPIVNLNEWWGPGDGCVEDEDPNIYSFKIKFTEKTIANLRHGWKNRRPLVAPLQNTSFEYGFNTNAMDLWMEYVTEEYPFCERQHFLNQYSHNYMYVQGLKIHFMRATSNLTGVELTPLVLVHGWRGSVREFYEAIPYLLSKAEKKGIALDIIAPSIPGFLFSDGAVRPGLGVDKVAVVFRNLVHKLGYSKFIIQGGDMGGMVTCNIATLFPEEVLGYHTNFPFVHSPDMIFRMLIGNFHKEEVVEPELMDRVYPSAAKFHFIVERSGYLYIQATKPDTFGIGLSDSPEGLLAHILESTGVPNNTGSVEAVKHIDNFMLYYSTNCAATAMRLYSNTFNKRYVGLRMNEIRTPVPTWVMQAPKELVYLPEFLLRQKFPNLLNVSLPAAGPHFFAWTMPEEYAEDVVNAIVAFKAWHVMNSTMYESCSSYINN